MPALPAPYPRMRLPAEWEPQEAIWLTWPQNRETWQPVLAEAEAAYAGLIRAILEYEGVVLLCDTEVRREELLGRLDRSPGAGRLDIRVCPTNDSWIRDYGALTVWAGSEGGPERLVSLDFRFNSWGGKYPPWDRDDAVPRFMAAARGRECIGIDFVLEGGSIEVNGRGLLLTTSQCLLNPNRNPGYDRPGIEAVLNAYLGAEHFLWLENGIAGDDTDGHVDDLARFADARTVFCAVESDRGDENYEALRRNASRLDALARRHDLEVVEVPMPSRQVKAGLRTPATYLNFLVLNGAVIVPVFRDRRDEEALALFERYFPARRILPLDCRALVFGQGAVHCSSLQEPRAAG